MPDLNDPETLRGALMEAVKEIQQDLAELSRLQQENSRLQEELQDAKDAFREMHRGCLEQWAEREKAEAENSQLREELAECAHKIPCAGPVSHRIDVIMRERGEALTRVAELEAKLAEEKERDPRWP